MPASACSSYRSSRAVTLEDCGGERAITTQVITGSHTLPQESIPGAIHEISSCVPRPKSCEHGYGSRLKSESQKPRYGPSMNFRLFTPRRVLIYGPAYSGGAESLSPD